ncbi:MAG: homocysteine S-methyltransferase family protein [Candidatus Omnitrophica bacterium]|nr:homocysteine S-methyltransferase family protein [Candidatus Omnitrophota bacterium]
MTNKKKIAQLLKKRIIVLDGAMGTQLYKAGMPSGVCPEQWCLQNPGILSEIHSDYIKSGSDIIYTATFGANRLKLGQYGIKDIFSVNKNLALSAKKAAKGRLVCGDIGPTGKFLRPFGKLEFEEAVDIFKEQAKGLIAAGVDLIAIETILDIQEARAALIAVKETADIFTFVTMTYEKNGLTLNGTDPKSALITLQSLGADALGSNCSTGPGQMLKIIKAIKPFATVPLVAKPNAGIPELIAGKTVFKMPAKTFASLSFKLAASGANMLGGCCGTTPAHIKELKKALLKTKPKPVSIDKISALSSARKNIILDNHPECIIIGEKINPTGKKKLQNEIKQGRFTLLRQLARDQQNKKAGLLDVNVAVPGSDEKKNMSEAISLLSVATELPLVIDSSDPDVIEKALRIYPGRAMINSISAERGKTDKLLLLAKKYGAMFILLPLSPKELPLTFKQRRENIQRIYKLAKEKGFCKKDFIVDGLVMSLSSNPESAKEFFKTIEWCRKKFKVYTIAGLSNVSFGLPRRHIINKAFLDLASKRGLNMAIADPSDRRMVKNRLARDLILQRPGAQEKFIARYSGFKEKNIKTSADNKVSPREKIYRQILEGNKEDMASALEYALKSGEKADVLMQEVMIPAVIRVGDYFEKKKYFLPQLIASAQAMKKGIACLNPYLKKDNLAISKKALIIVATVEGDIHDIGKNIVSLMLKNHGFDIIDLGMDVNSSKIIKAIKQYNPAIVGLSALMTTTMVNMKEVISLARKARLKCEFMVGGAAVTRDYAHSIGANYAKDAVAAVKLAEKLF